MSYLIAQGPEAGHRWRRKLPKNSVLILGRMSSTWGTPWDDRISRQHVEVHWNGSQLVASKIAAARNSIFFQGKETSEARLWPGEHFVIGSTTFTLDDRNIEATIDAPQPIEQQTFSVDYLRQAEFYNAEQRIDALSRLPHIMATAKNDSELYVQIVSLLMSSITQASAVALVALRKQSSDQPIEILHWDQRVAAQPFSPSERLIRQVLESRESIVHLWEDRHAPAPFTAVDGLDWAFCTPLAGEACQGWAIYVAGAHHVDRTPQSDTIDARMFLDEVKFVEIVATSLGGMREVRVAERMNQFFSPLVAEAIAGQNLDQVLAPREADVSVLFCDLRGFSRRSEQNADNLFGLLQRVSDALGVMTREILEFGGVVGDFHGDAAMGFWGWPLEQQDAAERACRTALAIRAHFEVAARNENDPLADFRIGIGIASGRAVAGKIGTVDQVKVTVFGPVVNLAARLQDMTKRLRTPILIDDSTAQQIRDSNHDDAGRVRRVAVVRPYGLQASHEISELVPPLCDFPQLSDQHIAAYEKALDSLRAGDWEKSMALLNDVPTNDRVKDFLAVFLTQHNRKPPEHWDGVIPF